MAKGKLNKLQEHGRTGCRFRNGKEYVNVSRCVFGTISYSARGRADTLQKSEDFRTVLSPRNRQKKVPRNERKQLVP